MEIAQNLKYYRILIVIAIPITTAISILLIYKYKREDAEPLNEGENSKSEQLAEISMKQDKINKSVFVREQKTKKSENPYYKQDLKKIFTSFRIYRLLIIIFTTSFLMTLNLNTFKVIGTVNQIPNQMLVAAQAIFAFLMAVSAPIWGALADKVKFKILCYVLQGITIAIGVTLNFALEIPILFASLAVATGLLSSGIQAINPPHVMHVFGIQYVIECAGVVGASAGIGTIIGSVFSFGITSLYGDGNKDEQNMSYRIMYIFSTALVLIGAGFLFFEGDDKFDYDRQDDKEINYADSDNRLSIRVDSGTSVEFHEMPSTDED